jgi:hypothetical protein
MNSDEAERAVAAFLERERKGLEGMLARLDALGERHASKRGVDTQVALEMLLWQRWLPPRVRRAVMAELGRSLQRENRDRESRRTELARVWILAIEGRMRRDRIQPRGGVHCAAVEAVAQEMQLTVEALRQRLKRRKCGFRS